MNEKKTNSEFKFLGKSIPTITIFYGLFLIVWGILVSFLSKYESVTSYFPSFLGLPIFISGLIANNIPEKRKLWMHIAVTFGLLSALGGTRFFMKMSDGINYATLSMLMLFLTGTIFTFICVKSFIRSRKARENS